MWWWLQIHLYTRIQKYMHSKTVINCVNKHNIMFLLFFMCYNYFLVDRLVKNETFCIYSHSKLVYLNVASNFLIRFLYLWNTLHIPPQKVHKIGNSLIFNLLTFKIIFIFIFNHIKLSCNMFSFICRIKYF